MSRVEWSDHEWSGVERSLSSCTRTNFRRAYLWPTVQKVRWISELVGYTAFGSNSDRESTFLGYGMEWTGFGIEGVA
ncbi:hypothetical protein AVEN_9499-1, partial [Araneus ventricosus]